MPSRPFVKSDANGPCAWRVVDPGSVLRLLRRAIKTAATPPMGPVFLALPMDVLDAPNSEPIARTSPGSRLLFPTMRRSRRPRGSCRAPSVRSS